MARNNILAIILFLSIDYGNCSYKYISRANEKEKFIKKVDHMYEVENNNIIDELSLSEEQCLTSCKLNKICVAINFYNSVPMADSPCHLLNTVGNEIQRANVNYISIKKEIVLNICNNLSNYTLCGPCKCQDTVLKEPNMLCNCTEATDKSLLTNCEEALNNTNYIYGLYNIKADGFRSIEVYCHKMEGEDFGCNLMPGDSQSTQFLKQTTNDNKDQCVTTCIDQEGVDGLTVGTTLNQYKNLCYCERTIYLHNILINPKYDTCLLTRYPLKDYSWITVLQVVEAPFYFISDIKYHETQGNPTGNYWLGLKNIYTLTSMFNLTLRIEYFLDTGDKIIIEYTKFKLLDEKTFAMTYAGYNPIRTNVERKDNMRCRKGQPFITTVGGGAWWGHSATDVPFHTQGLFWSDSINVKKMKMSLRNYEVCEFLSGIYTENGGSTQSMVVNMDRYTGKIWGHYFDSRYGDFIGLVESETDNECIGSINFSVYGLYTFISKAEECIINLFSGTSFIEYYGKTFCSPSRIPINCAEVQQLQCPSGLYFFNNVKTDC